MVDFARLTRKFVANPYEVISVIGECPITVDQIIAQAKLNYDVAPYESSSINAYILKAMNPSLAQSAFVEGDRIHFLINLANTQANPTLEVEGDTSRELVSSNGESLVAGGLKKGFYSAVLNETGKWQLVRLDFQETEWDYIYWLIRGCIRCAETYMNLDVVKKQYRTFRNDLSGDYLNVTEINELGGRVFSLRRGPVISVDSFTYTDEKGETITFDPTDDYYVAGEHVVLKNLQREPAKRLRVAQIVFTSGLSEIPMDLYGALLDHICQAYNSHGLCDGDACPAGLIPPAGAKAVYSLYKVRHIGE